ncbi:MAG TPA: hypothetical protein H9694_00980 [Firmicutes bacterium]|nr:hypothetical protein [Bacillota bacterium]
MKKIIASILALSLLAAISTTAFAAEINQDSPSKESEATITTSIAPTYLVSIPDDTSVAFNATETSFGSIEVMQAQIEPDKQIRVSLTADTADGSFQLVNSADETKAIPYTVNGEGGAFSSGVYTKAGDKTDLTIHIAQEDWNAAYAGSYSGRVIFTVSYEAAD